jgi:hypothetical protein
MFTVYRIENKLMILQQREMNHNFFDQSYRGSFKRSTDFLSSSISISVDDLMKCELIVLPNLFQNV